MTETEIEMVERHIQEGEVIVERQRGIIVKLAEGSDLAKLAEYLLAEFEATLIQHYEHHARIIGRDF